MAEEPGRDSGTERRVLDIVETAITELGGLGKLVQNHALGLIPPVIEASYVLVLHDEHGKSAEQIADHLGISRGAVETVFEAPITDQMPRAEHAAGDFEEFEAHADPETGGEPSTTRLEPEYLAGAVAKFAYAVMQRRSGANP